MNKEDYAKYYNQKADHYLVPADIFIELIDEMINWREDCKTERKEKEKLIKSLEEQIHKYKTMMENNSEMSNKVRIRFKAKIEVYEDLLREVRDE